MFTERIEASLTPDSLALFLAHANDAGNWSGNPILNYGNDLTPEQKGNLTDLKRKKLLIVEKHEGVEFVFFEPAGIALAAAHNITIETY